MKASSASVRFCGSPFSAVSRAEVSRAARVSSGVAGLTVHMNVRRRENNTSDAAPSPPVNYC